MSMILDALTRAEHERQLEQQPDLKFVNPVKPQKTDPKKIWLWVTLGLLANALILYFVIRTISHNESPEAEMMSMQKQSASQASVTSTPLSSAQAPVQQINSVASGENINRQLVDAEVTQPIRTPEARPLAMEVDTTQTPEVDRPLIYESKQTNTKPIASVPQKIATAPNTTVNKGKVSFSATELSVDDAVPITEKPKLLIDQGEPVTSSVQTSSSSSVPNLRDLPESWRTSLNQYEVNVHVFDTDPIRRFVLINMDKYKEGDRIVNNGPLVEEITPEGVVVDYGNGRALLPPK